MKHMVFFLLLTALPLISSQHSSAGQKESAASASAAASSASSTASSASKKPVTGLDEGKEGAASPLLKLVSKDGKEFIIPRELALRYSGLIRTGLEADKNENEFPLPSVSSNVVGQLITIIQMVDEKLHDPKFQGLITKALRDIPDTPRSRRASEIMSHGHALKSLSGLPELIYAANYLDAPLLLEILMDAYTQTPAFNGPVTQLLKDRANKKPGELRGALLPKVPALASDSEESAKLPLSSKIPAELFPALARSYFLRTGEDIDEFLGLKKVYIPFEDIIAYGFIPADFFTLFPGLEQKVNTFIYLPDSDAEETALTIAAIRGNTKAVRGLLKVRDVNLNHPDYTPLMQAGRSGMRDETPEIVAELLRAGANPDLIDKGGRRMGIGKRSAQGTALMVAARNSDLKSAQLLLAAGAKPDIQDANGKTALMHAVVGNRLASARNRLAMLKLLLQSKPDLSILSNEGQTALDLAAVLQYWDIALELLKAGADANSLMNITAWVKKTVTGDRASYEKDLQPFKDVIAYLRQKGEKDVATWLEQKVPVLVHHQI